MCASDRRKSCSTSAGRCAARGWSPFVEQGLTLLEPDIRLIIAGGGPDMPRLRELAARPEAASRILIVDAPDDDVAAMLRRSAGLFVMPNVPVAGDVEGYGITPLESMHSETPVAAFAVDALVESIREGGWLVPAGDYSAFADRIHEFFSLGESRRAELGREARQYVAARVRLGTRAPASTPRSSPAIPPETEGASCARHRPGHPPP